MKDMRTVVVGYDGSDDGRHAVEVAAEVVADGGIVHVVVAYRPPSVAETARLWAMLPDEFRESFDPLSAPKHRADDAERLLDRLGVEHRSRIIDDSPASAILDAVAELDADLVVLGSRGLGRTARFVRGSVSTRVATHAATSVLIVHQHGEGPESG